MPWEQHGSGYTKKHARRGRGGFVRNPDQYEALRRKGMSKDRAAAITNAHGGVSKMSRVSAFGVEHADDISKAIAVTQKGKQRKAEDAQLRSTLTRSQRAGAEIGGYGYTALKAPKGQKLDATLAHHDYYTGGKRGVRAIGAHQRHRTHSGAHATARKTWEQPSAVAKSAFGVEHTVLKAAGDVDTPKTSGNPPRASAGRYAAGTLFGGYHSIAAGKKGKRLAAVGSSVGHQLGGSVAGGAAGALLGRTENAARVGSMVGSLAGGHRAVTSNQAKGRYKPEQ